MEIKRNLNDYVGSLNVSSAKKNLSYAILEGAYLHRDKKGKGTRTVKFQDGTKQRVDTYEGRIKAAAKILGSDYSGLNKIYSGVLESNQKYFSKNIKAKQKLENYISQYKLNSSEKGRLELSLSGKNPSTIPNHSYFSGLRKNIGKIAAIAAVSAATIFGAYYSDLSTSVSKDSKNVEIKSSEKIIVYSPTKKTYRIVELEESPKEEFVEENQTQIQKQVANETKVYSDVSVEPMEDFFGSEEEISKFDFTEKPFSLAKDLGKYIEHVNARNSQIIKGENGNDISVNPKHLANHVVNNFVPFANEVTNSDDLGYGYKRLENRKAGIGQGLKKAGNGFLKFISAGYLDYNCEAEKEKEGNQALRAFKGIYDIPAGSLKAITDTTDFVFGGLVNKTIGAGKNLVDGTVNSGVDLVNYSLALPYYSGKKLENAINSNDGECNQKVYEILTSFARFGGNVVLHEVPRNGKTIEIISKDGNKITLDKGKTGPLAELLTCAAVDTLGIVGVSGGFSSGSGSVIHSHNGGGWNGNPVGN